MTNKQYKIIAICGEAGSGKDTILAQVVQAWPQTYHKIINTTTRPIRENEQPDIAYHFLSNEDFAQTLIAGDMIEVTTFRDWAYGTNINDLSIDKINIGVFNPAAIGIMLDDKRLEVTVFKIETDSKIRMLRQLNREECPDVDEIVRRYGADKIDFMELEFDYTELPNNNVEDLRKNLEFFELLGKNI